MSRLDEQLSEQFHCWEQRGRGWRVFPEPVEPEPPFVPFHGHYLPNTPAIDDGARPTFLSSLVQKLSQKLSTEKPLAPVEQEPEEEPEPTTLIRESMVELQTSLPAKLDIGKDAFEQFLRNLALCREPLAFELLGIAGRVSVQFAASPNDAPLVRRQLRSYFPEAVFQPREGALDQAWESCTGKETLVVEFGLAREFMLQLASGKLDPFIGMIGALSELQPGDLGLFQVLFQPAQREWAENIVRSVTHADGKPFFVNQPELAGAAEKKVASPLYAAVVRMATKGDTFERALEIARDMAGSLRVFAQPQGNELIPLHNEEYPFEEHIEDVLRRQSRRSGMLLNSDELIGFVHLPSSDVRSPALERDTGKTKAAPAIVRNATGLLLGNNVHFGESIPVRLTPGQRVQHTHIIGATGTGKSTLLFNLIRQDIENGEGVAVLDPSGDLIDRILGVIPDSRINDVVLVNPSDLDFPIAFNILSAHSELEKNLLASDLVSMFRRLSTSWGDQMDVVLRNAILAFLESSTGGTLSDLRRFLIEPVFRSQFLATVREPEVVYYWQKVFPNLTGSKSIGSVLTRLQTFLGQKSIRLMVSQRENRLDFGNIMDTGKIFLAKLPEGLMGTEDSYLFGTLLVSKFQQVALSRQAQQASSRRDFWLYIDEFDNFITPSMAGILSKTRKYRLGLTLSHHDLRQLQADTKVASAVMTNPATRIVFRVGDDDAKKLGESFSFFEARDLKNLETFQAIARVERSDYDFNLSVQPPEKSDEAATLKRRQEVITASREKYGTPRARAEASWGQLSENELADSKLAKTEPQREQSDVPKPHLTIAPTSASPATPIVPHISEAPKPAEVPRLEEKPNLPVSADAEESEHTGLKEQIGSEAESLDYTVTYEEHFPAVQGRADIVLRRGNKTIACQVTVTTPVGFEGDSVLKFLKVGFNHIAVISINRRKLNRIQQSLEATIPSDQKAKIGFYVPAEFISKLYDWAEDDPEGGNVERGKPRKQPIDLNAGQLSEDERSRRQQVMLETLRKVMKR